MFENPGGHGPLPLAADSHPSYLQVEAGNGIPQVGLKKEDRVN